MKTTLHTHAISIIPLLTFLLFAALALFMPDVLLAHGGEEEAVPDTILRGMNPIKVFGGAAIVIALFGFILFKVFRKK